MSMDETTTGEFANVREEARVARSRGAYFWVVMMVYMVVAPAIAILVSRQVSINEADKATRQTEAKLCAVVVLSDDYYRKLLASPTVQPPARDTLKRQARAMADLRIKFHCPPPRE
jgi:hypothetical protein